MKTKRLCLCLILVLLAVSALTAQTTRQRGVIRGIVTESGGDPLPGVTVTATSPALLGTISSVTGASGA